MRTKITLACTECKQRNYNTTKDKKAHPDRMETKKYCRFCKTHTMHKETKQFRVDYFVLFYERSFVMSDSPKKEKSGLKGFFKGVKTEFKKISWPDATTMLKQSVVVVAVSVVVGVLITLMDTVIQYGVSFLSSL